MLTQLTNRAPQTRCYECGDSQISSVCHHCGRAICGQHNSPLASAAPTQEFVALGLEETKCGVIPVHCEYCTHVVRKPGLRLMGVGIVLFLIGLGTLGSYPRFGSIATLVGVALSAAGIYFNIRLRAANRSSRPPLPLLVRFDQIQVREVLRGQIRLDQEGVYRETIASSEGVLTMQASYAKPELQRFQQYRKKYRLPEDDDASFHFGFVVPRGALGLELTNGRPGGDRPGLVLPLTGQVSQQPFLAGSDAAHSGEIRVTQRYTLSDTARPESLPIRLVPWFVQDTGRRAMELELQWHGLDPGLTISSIEKLQLHVPIEWGEVENLAESAVIGTAGSRENPGAVSRTITWRRLNVPFAQRQEGRHLFYMAFDGVVDTSDSIGGTVEVMFDGTLSGATGVDLYYPVGTRRVDAEPDVRTRVEVEFTLSLSGLRYFDVRIVPGKRMAADGEQRETIAFEGIVPDHATIVALTNAMSREGFYVKRVVENPPRIGAQANLVNRLWDIVGRYYVGVYPIDFHLIVAGEERYSGEVRAQGGTTKLTLSVQGTYSDPSMEEGVEQVWARLSGLIADTLSALPPVAPAQARSRETDEAASETHWDESVGSVGTASVAPGVKERVERLRARLDGLQDAVAEGRLSESRYVEMKTAIEIELAELLVGS
jgi:hypothetical protein